MLGRDILLFETLEKSIRLHKWIAAAGHFPARERSKAETALSRSVVQREQLIAKSMRQLRSSNPVNIAKPAILAQDR